MHDALPVYFTLIVKYFRLLYYAAQTFFSMGANKALTLKTDFSQNCFDSSLS